MTHPRYMSTWTLAEAVVLLKEIFPVLEGAGFAVGLTGSVLLRGESKHDLDIIVYPLSSSANKDFEPARSALLEAGLNRLLAVGAVRMAWRRKGSLDEKEVEVWQWRDRRVDVFFLR